jgi:hypothetical protein
MIQTYSTLQRAEGKRKMSVTQVTTPPAVLAFLCEIRPELSPHRQQQLDALLAGDPDAALRLAVGEARLTPTQMQVLACIDGYWREYGYSPSMQEVADNMGVSKTTICEHVDALCQKGVLARGSKYKARSLRLRQRD